MTRVWIVLDPGGRPLYCGKEEWEAWDEAWQGEQLSSATLIRDMKAGGWRAIQMADADEVRDAFTAGCEFSSNPLPQIVIDEGAEAYLQDIRMVEP